METTMSLHHSTGARAIYAFGCSFGNWDGFDVVRFNASEAISELYRYEITLVRSARAGRVDLGELVGRDATFRLALADRWRSVNGIIAEAEELECTSERLFYRVLLTAPFWRARHEVHCRTFVDKSLREILGFILENCDAAGSRGPFGLSELPGLPQPPSPIPSFEVFSAPGAFYFFHLQDEERLRDPNLRSYVVQYNETNYDFFMRLLAEEGLSVVHSQIEQGSVLTVTDRPAYEPFFPKEAELRLRSGRVGENAFAGSVWNLTQARRLRAGSVHSRDWDENRPQAPLEGRALIADPAHPQRLALHVFPGRDEAVARNPGAKPAALLLDRETVESAMSEGWSACRSLEPGFSIHVTDDVEARDPSTWTVVQVDSCGMQLAFEGTILDELPFGLPGARRGVAPYENRFRVLPEEIIHRPSPVSSRPRIDGVQTAIVTAEEVFGEAPEIHCNERGSIRVRFPWDERREPGRPSSAWVRVSQAWAGAGFGTMMIPRVGQEVLVSYLQGDPERPVVVGRVYNAVEPVPYSLPQAKTVSTWKSQSSPSSEGFNELRFEDAAGREEIYLHAQKNLNEVVLASHSESVGGDQSYSIGGNQSFHVGQNQVNTIEGRRSVFVTGLHYTQQLEYKSVCDTIHTFESVNTAFTVKDMFGVSSTRSRIYGTDHVLVRGDGHVHVDSNSEVRLSAGGAVVEVSPGYIRIDNGVGAKITLIGGAISIEAPGLLQEKVGSLQAIAGAMHLDGGSIIDAKAGVIHLNG